MLNLKAGALPTIPHFLILYETNEGYGDCLLAYAPIIKIRSFQNSSSRSVYEARSMCTIWSISSIGRALGDRAVNLLGRSLKN